MKMKMKMKRKRQMSELGTIIKDTNCALNPHKRTDEEMSFDIWIAAVERRAYVQSGGIFDFKAISFPWADYYHTGKSSKWAANELLRAAIKEAKDVERKLK